MFYMVDISLQQMFGFREGKADDNSSADISLVIYHFICPLAER